MKSHARSARQLVRHSRPPKRLRRDSSSFSAIFLFELVKESIDAFLIGLKSRHKEVYDQIAALDSWKFPAKKCLDASIREKVETITLGDDEDENCFNHSMLLEILIDRCLISKYSLTLKSNL